MKVSHGLHVKVTFPAMKPYSIIMIDSKVVIAGVPKRDYHNGYQFNIPRV